MPLSDDLRIRVVKAIRSGDLTWRGAAAHFRVGEATVGRWMRLFRETGGVAPRPHRGGRPRAVDETDETTIRALVVEKPDRTLEELVRELARHNQTQASPSSM